MKEEGNRLFMQSEFEAAVAKFSDGVTAADGNPELKSQLYSNRSLARFQLQDYVGACEDGALSVAENPANYKGYYREAIAAYKLGAGHLDKALQMCQTSIEMHEEQLGFESDVGQKLKADILQAIKLSKAARRAQQSRAQVEKCVVPPSAKAAVSANSVLLQLESAAPPKSGYDILKALNALKCDPEQIFHYFNRLAPKDIETIYRSSIIEPEIVEAFTGSLRRKATEGAHPPELAALIRALLRAKQVGVALRMVQPSYLEELRQAIAYCSLPAREELQQLLGAALEPRR